MSGIVANTGNLAIAFNEEGINTSGSLTKSLRNPSAMSKARARAAKTIRKISSDKNEPLGITISKVLLSPGTIPELQSYVQARGETPNSNPTNLAIQAALIRASEIGTVAKAIDTTDQDALGIIEDSEQQHVEDNTGETSGILSPQAAGALSLLVQRISSKFGRSLSDWTEAVKNYSGSSSFAGVNNGGLVNNLGDIDYSSIFLPTDQSDSSDQSQTLYGDSSTDTSGSGGSFWSNLFDNIDNVVGAVQKVSGAIQTATGAINTTVGNVNTTSSGIINKVTDIGGQAGSKAIGDYISNNIGKIILFAIALIVLTLILVRVTNR
jgi:hypothetical protein